MLTSKFELFSTGMCFYVLLFRINFGLWSPLFNTTFLFPFRFPLGAIGQNGCPAWKAAQVHYLGGVMRGWLDVWHHRPQPPSYYSGGHVRSTAVVVRVGGAGVCDTAPTCWHSRMCGRGCAAHTWPRGQRLGLPGNELQHPAERSLLCQLIWVPPIHIPDPPTPSSSTA